MQRRTAWLFVAAAVAVALASASLAVTYRDPIYAVAGGPPTAALLAVGLTVLVPWGSVGARLSPKPLLVGGALFGLLGVYLAVTYRNPLHAVAGVLVAVVLLAAGLAQVAIQRRAA